MNEEKKEYLKSYKKICDKLQSLEEQLKSLRAVNEVPKSQIITDMPRGSTRQDITDYVVKISELEKEINNKIRERLAMKCGIEKRIANVDDGIESSILRKKYIEFKKWEKICVEIGYSWRQTHYIHSRALNSFVL